MPTWNCRRARARGSMKNLAFHAKRTESKSAEWSLNSGKKTPLKSGRRSLFDFLWAGTSGQNLTPLFSSCASCVVTDAVSLRAAHNGAVEHRHIAHHHLWHEHPGRAKPRLPAPDAGRRLRRQPPFPSTLCDPGAFVGDLRDGPAQPGNRASRLVAAHEPPCPLAAGSLSSPTIRTPPRRSSGLPRTTPSPGGMAARARSSIRTPTARQSPYRS